VRSRPHLRGHPGRPPSAGAGRAGRGRPGRRARPVRTGAGRRRPRSARRGRRRGWRAAPSHTPGHPATTCAASSNRRAGCVGSMHRSVRTGPRGRDGRGPGSRRRDPAAIIGPDDRSQRPGRHGGGPRTGNGSVIRKRAPGRRLRELPEAAGLTAGGRGPAAGLVDQHAEPDRDRSRPARPRRGPACHRDVVQTRPWTRPGSPSVPARPGRGRPAGRGAADRPRRSRHRREPRAAADDRDRRRRPVPVVPVRSVHRHPPRAAPRPAPGALARQNASRERGFGTLNYERLFPEETPDVLDLIAHAEDYRTDYNTLRPHEALSWNRPVEVHTGPRRSAGPQLSRARTPANSLTRDISAPWPGPEPC
jgi:hypothetical protein